MTLECKRSDLPLNGKWLAGVGCRCDSPDIVPVKQPVSNPPLSRTPSRSECSWLSSKPQIDFPSLLNPKSLFRRSSEPAAGLSLFFWQCGAFLRVCRFWLLWFSFTFFFRFATECTPYKHFSLTLYTTRPPNIAWT